jgi:hypothetical protein
MALIRAYDEILTHPYFATIIEYLSTRRSTIPEDAWINELRERLAEAHPEPHVFTRLDTVILTWLAHLLTANTDSDMEMLVSTYMDIKNSMDMYYPIASRKSKHMIVAAFMKSVRRFHADPDPVSAAARTFYIWEKVFTIGYSFGCLLCRNTVNISDLISDILQLVAREDSGVAMLPILIAFILTMEHKCKISFTLVNLLLKNYQISRPIQSLIAASIPLEKYYEVGTHYMSSALIVKPFLNRRWHDAREQCLRLPPSRRCTLLTPLDVMRLPYAIVEYGVIYDCACRAPLVRQRTTEYSSSLFSNWAIRQHAHNMVSLLYQRESERLQARLSLVPLSLLCLNSIFRHLFRLNYFSEMTRFTTETDLLNLLGSLWPGGIFSDVLLPHIHTVKQNHFYTLDDASLETDRWLKMVKALYIEGRRNCLEDAASPCRYSHIAQLQCILSENVTQW